jgi:hypothetical protein
MQTDLFPALLGRIPDPPPSAPLFTQHPILCKLSGVCLGVMNVGIVEGAAPLLQNFGEIRVVHPFFGASDYHLIRKLTESLEFCASREWEVEPPHVERMQILMVALMERLGCIRQEFPQLPRPIVAIASASRLLTLADWWLNNTTRRIVFPTFSVSRQNENIGWTNFRFWLDSAFEHRKAWELGKAKVAHESELRTRELAAREVASSSVRRADLKKVWNWMELQFSGHYHPGTIQTMKTVFFTADLAPDTWIKEDVQDLETAVNERIDMESDTAFFVRKRIRNLYEAIEAYEDSFRIVSVRSKQGMITEAASAAEVAAAAEIFNPIDAEIAEWTTVPPAPKRNEFTTLAYFLRAQARWTLQKQRFEQKQARKAGAVRVVTVSVPALQLPATPPEIPDADF